MATLPNTVFNNLLKHVESEVFENNLVFTAKWRSYELNFTRNAELIAEAFNYHDNKTIEFKLTTYQLQILNNRVDFFEREWISAEAHQRMIEVQNEQAYFDNW